MNATEYTIAASMHLGQSVKARDDDEYANTQVERAYNWATSCGYIKSYAGFLPDLESVLNTDDVIAREYCHAFDVNLLDYTDTIETELGMA